MLGEPDGVSIVEVPLQLSPSIELPEGGYHCIDLPFLPHFMLKARFDQRRTDLRHHVRLPLCKRLERPDLHQKLGYCTPNIHPSCVAAPAGAPAGACHVVG